MSVSIQILGVKKTKAFLRKKKLNTNIQANIGLTKAAIFMQGEVKSSIAGRRSEPTSVDTGRFLNSIGFTAGKLDAIVFSLVNYARFLEFGTSRFVGRRHFNNSLDRNRLNIRNILNKQIKNI